MEHITAGQLAKACGGRILCGDPDREIKKIRLDSRQVEKDDLFVALVGEKVDGHKFIPQVIAAGAGAVLMDETPRESAAIGVIGSGEAPVLIAAADTKTALQDIGRYMRARLSLPLVGVTGSVGKTTTRELIAAALSARYQVYKTPGNSNSQVGVPVTISEISSSDEIGVIELGMSEPGELTVIAKIAQIDAAVITNIGITHIEQLGSRENIFREKMTIQDGLKKGGALIVNGDDDLLANVTAREDVTVITYGTGEGCDYRAVDIRMVDGMAQFTAVHGKERQKVALKALGKHNVWNALAGIAVCGLYGMSMEEAARGLASFHGFAHRQQLLEGTVKETGAKITVLDDSYNASPASMTAALDVFKEIRPGKRHVAVLADMKELGEEAGRYHRKLGLYAAKSGVDEIVVLGELCRELAEGAREAKEAKDVGVSQSLEIREFMEKEAVAAYLSESLKDGDCVLFKGSNSMGLSAVADGFAKGMD